VNKIALFHPRVAKGKLKRLQIVLMASDTLREEDLRGNEDIHLHAAPLIERFSSRTPYPITGICFTDGHADVGVSG